MAVFFKSGELYRMAMEMERMGFSYYSELASHATNAEVKNVFQYLATAEKRHLRVFKRLWNTTSKSGPPESYRGEYKNYLIALLKDKVFSSSAAARSRAIRSSLISALNTGIKAEKDSILFYSGLLDVTPTTDNPAITKILSEEKKHLRKLLDYKYKSDCIK